MRKRGLLISIAVFLLAGCGGRSADAYARDACKALGTDAHASPVNPNPHFVPGDVDRWTAAYGKAADLAAKAANKSAKWQALARSISAEDDVLVEYGPVMKAVTTGTTTWRDHPDMASALRGLAPDGTTIHAECRKVGI